jgi:hypothetical protein
VEWGGKIPCCLFQSFALTSASVCPNVPIRMTEITVNVQSVPLNQPTNWSDRATTGSGHRSVPAITVASPVIPSTVSWLTWHMNSLSPLSVQLRIRVALAPRTYRWLTVPPSILSLLVAVWLVYIATLADCCCVGLNIHDSFSHFVFLGCLLGVASFSCGNKPFLEILISALVMVIIMR